jgi:hypothetical protein
MDEIEVEGHQLGRRIAVVRLAMGRIGMQVRAQSPRSDTEQPAVLARSCHRLDMAIGRHRAHEQTDLQQPSRAAGGVAHALCLVEVERQRAFAEHVLARLEGGDHDVMMDGARQADVDGVDIVAADQFSGTCPIARNHARHGYLGHVGVGGGMHGSHAACAQDGDADLRQASPPA